MFCSPLRRDKHKTCSVFRSNSGTLLFKDFATGQAINCFEVVKSLYNCDYFTALKIIANDFGLIKDKTIKKNKGLLISKDIKVQDKEMSKIQVEIQDFTELELKWWGKYGITLDILKKYNVYSCKSVFLNGNLYAQSSQNCPIFGYYGGKIKENGEKIELWRCYFPKLKEKRFLSNWPSNKIQGFSQLPAKGNICVITKSLKDVACLDSFNIPACAPNSECIIPSKELVDNLTRRFKHVFCLWDCDLTGITFLNKIKREYPQLKCLIIPRRLKAKDFSDLREKYGYKKTKQFILEYLRSVKTKI